MTSRRRGYLLALAASLMLTVGIVSLGRWLQRTRGAWAAIPALAVVAVAFVATSANRLQTFGPCSPASQRGDIWLYQDMVQYLAPELGPWLEARITSCDPDTYRPIVETLPVATWTHGAGATMLVTETARAVQVRARVTGPTAVPLVVSMNGRPRPSILVEPGAWIEFEVPLESSWLTRLRRSNRVDFRSTGVEIQSGEVRY
jgi:hypothetical protein